MSDQSTLSALVEAWEAVDAAVGEELAQAQWVRAGAIVDFAYDHGLDPQFVRSEMLRMRSQKRPVPDRAAVLVAIIEGTDQ